MSRNLNPHLGLSKRPPKQGSHTQPHPFHITLLNSSSVLEVSYVYCVLWSVVPPIQPSQPYTQGQSLWQHEPHSGRICSTGKVRLEIPRPPPHTPLFSSNESVVLRATLGVALSELESPLLQLQCRGISRYQQCARTRSWSCIHTPSHIHTETMQRADTPTHPHRHTTQHTSHTTHTLRTATTHPPWQSPSTQHVNTHMYTYSSTLPCKGETTTMKKNKERQSS